MANLGFSDVHYYQSTMTSAPGLQYLAGSLISILDACLIDGFGSEAPQGGWVKVFSGTNQATYQSADIDGTQLYLRVNDTLENYARLIGYEDLAGTVLFPTTAQLSGGVYVTKSSQTYYDPRKWTLFADNRAVYFFSTPNDPAYDNGYDSGFGFGDIVSYKSDDQYGCFIVGQNSETGESRIFALTLGTTTGLSGNLASYLARGYTQTGASIELHRYGSARHQAIGDSGPVYPSPVDGMLHVSPISCWDGTSTPRGQLPGIYDPIVSPDNVAHGTIITNVKDIPGRSFFMQSICRTTEDFRGAIDITGPWRDNGSLVISGKVTELLVPGSYQVNLFRQSDMQLLQSVWSDANGDYAFTGLKSQKHVLMAIDHTDPLRTPAVQDNVIPS